MKISFLCRAFMVLAIGAASATEPTSPVDTTPTPGAEIKRGIDAASACSGTLSASDYVHCIFAVEARNQPMVVDYKPFDTGLFFKAWITMDLRANPTQPPANDLEIQGVEAARHQSASMYIVFRADQRKVGVADEQLIDASNLPKSLVESRLTVWANQPPP
jgi:hypothetical protein